MSGWEVFQDGKIVLRSTSITTWLRCPKKFFFSYILNAETSGSISTQAGSLVQEMLSDYALSKNMDAVLVKYWNRIKDLPTSGRITRDHILMLAAKYTDRYSEMPQRVEQKFEFEYEPGVLIRGAFDGLIEHNGLVYVFERKTGSKSNSYDAEHFYRMKMQYPRSFQIRLYDYVAQKMFKDRYKGVVLELIFFEPGKVEIDRIDIMPQHVEENIKFVLDSCLADIRRLDFMKNWTACYEWGRPCEFLNRCEVL